MTKTYDSTLFSALISKAFYATDVGPLLSFDGRDDYVAFVHAWRIECAEIVEEIRGAKRIRMDKSNAVGVRNSAQERRQQLRQTANTLMRIREAGKVHARAAHAAKIGLAA